MNEKIKSKIDEIVKATDVCLFMKGTPDVPQCGFSLAVSNVLKHLEVNFKGINVLEDPDIRSGKKEFIGGCDIIKEMFEKGELQNKFKEQKINYKEKQ